MVVLFEMGIVLSVSNRIKRRIGLAKVFLSRGQRISYSSIYFLHSLRCICRVSRSSAAS